MAKEGGKASMDLGIAVEQAVQLGKKAGSQVEVVEVGTASA